MVEFTCEAIGMEQDELQERVVQGLVERILGDDHDDPEGHVHREAFKEAMKQVEAAVDAKVKQMAEEHIYPMAEKLITDHVFQKTNQWGEKKDEPKTFVEYLVDRADKFFTEKVDRQGKTRSEVRYGNDWRESGARIVVMIDNHLESAISVAMKRALENANNSIAEGIAETARTKLYEMAKTLKVEVKAK